MNITVDNAIFKLQQNGGISRLWRSLLPHLQMALPEANWNTGAPDVFISTYYEPKPDGAKSLVLVYDMIAEQYKPIGAYNPDAIKKRAAIAEADAVVTISQSVADDVQRILGRQADVAYCGVDPMFCRVSEAKIAPLLTQFNLTKPYVLTVGRRGLYKNIKALYQAWALWPMAQQFNIVQVGGEKDLPEDAQFDLQFPGVRRQIQVNDNDLPAIYSGAYALVYPSFIEGFGLPVLEAIMCGCPVIAGLSSSLHELSLQIPYMLMVKPHRPLDIANALTQLQDSGLRFDMTINAYAPARAFTWSRMADTIAKAVRSIA